MQTRSVIKIARENKSPIEMISIRDLTAAIVTLEYKRLLGEENGARFELTDKDTLDRLHDARCLNAENALAGYVDDASEERAR